MTGAVRSSTTDAAGMEQAEAASPDSAWVSIETRLDPAELRAFVDDVERLFRINPLMEVAEFELLEPDRYRMRARNLSNARDVDVELEVARQRSGIKVNYSGGLKTATWFEVEEGTKPARLRVSDHYDGTPESERRRRLDEVDLSLNAWGRALHDHLRHWAKWRWLAPWRWYMARVWQPMRPSARRIVYMIWIISLFEVAALVVIGGLLIASGGIAPATP